MAEAVILIKDLQGEKSGRIGILPASSKNVHRGELLLSIPRNKIVPRKDGKLANNYQMATDPAVTVYCTENDIAPLSEYEFHLLLAVNSRLARYDVFQNDRLDWGSKLKCGDLVFATLPSKSPVPNHPVASKIQFIGPLPNENGILFGVEIINPKYRDHGSSDGTFGELQFFKCEENAGLFVSLDRLSPMNLEPPQQNTRPPADGRQHPMVTRSQDQGGQPSQPNNQQQRHQNRSPTPKQPKQPLFNVGDRVVAHDRKGKGIHGSVRWMGNAYNGVENVPSVGIETDVAVQSKEFLGSLPGLGGLFKCKDSKHGRLVMPETMVVLEHKDAAKRDKQKQLKKESSVDGGVSEFERDTERAKELSQVEYKQGVINITGVEQEEQIRALKEFEKANEEKKQRLAATRPERNSGGHYEPIPGARGSSDQPPPYTHQPTSYPRGMQTHVPASTASSSAEARKHNFDSPGRSRKDLMKMKENLSVQDEYLSGRQHSHLSPGGASALQHQLSAPGNSVDDHATVYQPPHQPSDPHYHNLAILKDSQQQVMAQNKRHSDGDYANIAPELRFAGSQPGGSSYPGNAMTQGSTYREDHFNDTRASRSRDPAYQQGYHDGGASRRNQGYAYSQYGTAGGPPPSTHLEIAQPTQLPPDHGPQLPPDYGQQQVHGRARAEVQQPIQSGQYPGVQSQGMPHEQQGMQQSDMQHPAAYHQHGMPHQPGARQPHAHHQPSAHYAGAESHDPGLSQPRIRHGDVPLAQEGGAMAFTEQSATSHSFTMGSTVQLSSDPPRYGVIRWMGSLEGIHGQIAGVELEDPIDGAQDGTWKGARYFVCRQGHGFFCPVSSLMPDARFTPNTSAGAAVNPLDFVAYEEERDQFIDPGQIDNYIGEAKGIQGHQNSCYLDSTVFGLFALSDVFDSMFLEQGQGDQAGDDVKHLLWKGIVNPLRKNGVVRFESVMGLRNKLEELGKMKGVNQDEKDPEEFLNMLFKHTLHVTPFIKIKRPFGVEQEYFVQLFVEQDKSLQLPTVGDLLTKMFLEQKIRFTKVPSKLLIQIPRYGREFKTYQKTIPGLKLGLTKLVCSKNKCFICADSAWTECRECISEFVDISQPPSTPPDVVYFCETCSKLAHGEPTKRFKHNITEVTPDLGGVNELDLLSVICIETSHYICFTRSEERWVFFDSMASRVEDMYNIPKVVDCTDVLNEWVYPANGDMTRLLNTPPKELPEYVRRFTQDIYLVVYIQPDFAMYGDVEDDDN